MKWVNLIIGFALLILGIVTPYRIASVIGIIMLIIAWAKHSKGKKDDKPEDYYRT
jgi:uncharacterized membrane protein